jgi:hypothetical protein
MNILSTSQYNQGMGKSKLLSSTSGVGAVITTKAGYYVLISDINKWRCVEAAQKEIAEVRADHVENEWPDQIKKKLQRIGLTTIDDPRFIAFLKEEKELGYLVALIGIPHLSLHEHFNTVNASNNPILQQLKERGENASAENFMVPGTHFPKWFRNRKGDLMTYEAWLERWLAKDIKKHLFAPPRDADDAIKKNGAPVIVTLKDPDGVPEKVTLYQQLTQINLTLICRNGHLSDIPWSRLLAWKIAHNKNSDNLFDHPHCCAQPRLHWSENKTRSDGYSSIYLECKNCQQKVNLEGVNNLKPCCKGEKPWEIEVESKDHSIPRDPQCVDAIGRPQTMQVALATANNTYFADGFSSIYIPQHLIDGIDERLAVVIEKYHTKYDIYQQFEQCSKEVFYDRFMTREKLVSDGFGQYIEEISDLEDQLRKLFLGVEEEVDDIDTHEHYRWQEYQCFMNNVRSPLTTQDLSFKDIDLPTGLHRYFTKIQQVDELKVCQVQLDFTRVEPVERVKRGHQIMNSHEGQDIYSVDTDNLFVLPANEIYGEGVFLGFNEAAIGAWYETHKTILAPMLKKLIGTYEEHGQGSGPKRKIVADGYEGAKFLLIHSLSHLLMRELEFSCGYPTASLKERLYISERMSGVLIYTAEGSEGSMGGLVWQGQRDKIADLLQKALDRAQDCSSDPLCWTSDGQGLFNLNLAACFSCSMVSETACEEWNLGLDRRILIDPAYGFFANY